MGGRGRILNALYHACLDCNATQMLRILSFLFLFCGEHPWEALFGKRPGLEGAGRGEGGRI